MLGLVSLVGRFNEIEHALPEDWATAQLALTVENDDERQRAAALLGPVNPGRSGDRIRFATSRRGAGASPELMRRLLRRLDDAGVNGELELVSVDEAPEAELQPERSLRGAWSRALATLPSDWSDLYAQVRFDSTDYLERGALNLSPVNPMRYGDGATLRFRCAHSFGYGVSAEMAGRCLQRCDDEGITGTVEILRVLSDTNPVQTQGPVWIVGGRSV
jgi:hypothetical protein